MTPADRDQNLVVMVWIGIAIGLTVAICWGQFLITCWAIIAAIFTSGGTP